GRLGRLGFEDWPVAGEDLTCAYASGVAERVRSLAATPSSGVCTESILPTLGASQRSMSSTSVKAAGTITSVNIVEVIKPPITATAIGPRKELSPWKPIATGSMPATIATVVMTIGRARLWPA